MVIGLVLSSAFSAILVYAQELVPGRIGLISGLLFGLALGLGGIGAALLWIDAWRGLVLPRLGPGGVMANLVERGFLESDKRGRGNSYRFPATADRQVIDAEGLTSSHWVPSSSPLASRSSHLGASSSHPFSGASQGGTEAPDGTEGMNTFPEEDPQLLALAAPIRSRGKAPEQEVRAVILRLCRGRFLTLRELAGLLRRTPANLRNRFLAPMVQARLLE